MKTNTTYLLISLIAGFVAMILWVLRMWYVNDINVALPSMFNAIQFFFLALLKR